jgi:hypothetical protein
MAGIDQCEDFMMFQRALKQLRELDDKIIYALNLSTPTASMVARGADPKQSCQLLQAELGYNNKHREERISSCISLLGARVKELKRDGGNVGIATSTLRLMRTELNVEEIINDRTQTIFNSKCKEFL